MKKSFTGMICTAAIAAASLIILPVTAVMVAVRLSKPRNRSRKVVTPAENGQSMNGSLTQQYRIDNDLSIERSHNELV